MYYSTAILSLFTTMFDGEGIFYSCQTLRKNLTEIEPELKNDLEVRRNDSMIVM